VPWNATFLR